MVRFWSRGPQKGKFHITEILHFRASATKTKSGFWLILIGCIRRRLKIYAAESSFSLESFIFYKITKYLQKGLKARKKGPNSLITAIEEKLQTSITLSFFNNFQRNLVCAFLLLCWILKFLYVVIRYK